MQGLWPDGDGWEGIWGYNPMQDDRSDFTQSRPLYGDINPHVQWTPRARGADLIHRAEVLHNLSEHPEQSASPGWDASYGKRVSFSNFDAMKFTTPHDL